MKSHIPTYRILLQRVWPFFLAYQAAVSRGEQYGLDVLTSASQIRHLTRENSALAYPVQLKGVVTYSDPFWGLLFIRDDTGGIYVELSKPVFPSTNEVVEVTGQVGEGGFQAIVTGASCRVVGRAEMPASRPMARPDAFAGELDCEWLESQGVVRRVDLMPDKRHFQIDLAENGWRTRVFLLTSENAERSWLDSLIDSKVGISGVGGMDIEEGGVRPKLFVPSTRFIHVIEQVSDDPFKRPALGLDKIRGFSGKDLPAHRIHVRGVATYLADSTEVILQEGAGAVRIRCVATNRCEVGDVVEAIGFLTTTRSFSPILEDAEVRKGTGQVQARIAPVKPSQILWGGYDSRLVELMGRIEDKRQTASGSTMALLAEGVLFGVSVHSTNTSREWANLEKGDYVRVTGICAIEGDLRGLPQSFQVMLRSAADVIRVSRDRWLSTQQMLTIGTLAGGGSFAGLLWLVSLRRQVREQTRIIRGNFEKELALEKRYHHLLENTTIPVLIVDRASLSIRYANQRAAMHLFGGSKAPAPSSALDCFDQVETGQRLLDELDQHGQVSEFEVCFKTVNGKRFWATACANQIEFDERQAICLSFSDISERKRVEEALRASEERYRGLFEAESDAVLLVDRKSGEVLEANQAALNLYGYSKEEFTALKITDLSVEPEETRRAIEETVVHVPLRRHRKKNGAEFPVEICTSYFKLRGLDVHVAAIRDISERRRAEEQIELLKKSIDAHHDGAYWIDINNRVIYVNEAGCKVLGYTRAELLGKTVVEVNPAATPEFMNQVWEKLRREKTYATETVHRRKDGSQFSVEILATYIQFGGQEYSCGFAHDITERKRAEIALRESEAKFRSLFDSAKDAILLSDGKVFLSCNSQCEAMFGRPREEIIGHSICDFTPPRQADGQDSKEAAAAVIRRARTGEKLFFEWRLCRKDGTSFDTEVSLNGIELSGKICFQAIVRDVTERKQAEEQVRKLSQAVEQSPASVVITDVSGKIEYVNPKFTELTGYSMAEVLGKNPSILKSGETPDNVYSELWRSIGAGKEWRGEFHNKKKNGEFYWEIATISPIRNGNGVITSFLAVKEDITERRRLQEQLRQVQKMEAVGQLAGGIAHDFNNILAASLLLIELLQKTSDLQPEIFSALDELKQGMNRAADLTRQLLLFSRREVMRPRRVEINTVVEGLLKLLKRTLGEHIDLTLQASPQPLVVEADPSMLEQVVINLAVNARDAMPKGGRLTLATRLVSLNPEDVRENSDARAGSFVCLSVEDNGDGMDEPTLKRIFEPFFTTKEPGKGTGLGLATVYGIVRQHRGWIDVESVIGQGSRFRVYVPASETAGAVEPRLVESNIKGGNEVVLLVEDDQKVRHVVKMVLRLLGYEVLEACNGVEALRIWEEQGDRVNLLLSDMVMPEGMTGLDLAQRLREARPELKVLISSGYSAGLSGSAGTSLPGIRFLSKPYDPETLAKVLRQLLDEELES